jgi:hypothetical protein
MSYPRPSRPAATDFFNPAEQVELLRNIKAREENKQPPAQSAPSTNKDTEVSLREKLEKAKADKQAKANAESTAQNGDKKQDTVTTGPPPPIPGISTGSIMPYSTPGWSQYSQGAPVPSPTQTQRAYYQFPQSYPQPFMNPYGNTQSQPAQQWGQLSQQSTPGVPPPPSQPNQGHAAGHPQAPTPHAPDSQKSGMSSQSQGLPPPPSLLIIRTR